MEIFLALYSAGSRFLPGQDCVIIVKLAVGQFRPNPMCPVVRKRRQVSHPKTPIILIVMSAIRRADFSLRLACACEVIGSDAASSGGSGRVTRTEGVLPDRRLSALGADLPSESDSVAHRKGRVCGRSQPSVGNLIRSVTL